MVSKDKSYIDIYEPMKYVINDEESRMYANEVLRAFKPKIMGESYPTSGQSIKTHPRASLSDCEAL